MIILSAPTRTYTRARKLKCQDPNYMWCMWEIKRIYLTQFLYQKRFFCGADDIAVDIKVKVICESDTNSIINQYITFSKVYDEQRIKYGRTKKAITETIRICKGRNVLREYLEDREKEVVSIMMSLYNEEEVMRSYIKSERYEAEQNKAKKTAIHLLKLGKMSLEDIAEATELPLDTIKELA